MTSPNPTWKPGDKIKAPFEEMVSVEPDSMRIADVYKLLIGSIVPRPIAFITTINGRGVVNLSPFSFFNGVSSNPACLSVSFARKPDGGKKDTLRNIEENRQFVVNCAAEWLVEPLTYSAAEHGSEVSELELTGLTAISSAKVAPPRVKESPIQMECELYKAIEIGEGEAGSATLVVGKILVVHLAREAYDGGRVMLDRIKPISRLGGFRYGKIGEIFDIPVPKI